MIFLLKYWRFLAGALAGAVLMAGVMEVRVGLLKATQGFLMEKQRQELVKQCEENTRITIEAENEYQNQIADLNRRLAELRRLHNTIVPVTRAATGDNANAGPGHADRDGISAGSLFGYAGTAEQYRRQLIACQDFIRAERE